ncbi:COG4315 family predicted lipoprotein [Gynuella sp.]|uniref:COG4315 family predicted lipoprotein n=1 Tax=Gynuella sp. TaxID=2969146 RepID=UPI003D1386FF
MKRHMMLITTAFSLLSLNAFADGYGTSSYSSTHTMAKADTVVIKTHTSVGEVFATVNGLTLYTFSKDGVATSSCYNGCAANWPPFKAQKNAKTWGDFSIIERDDGNYQWAYKDQPLYTWVGDHKLGDTHGQGIGGVWYAAQANQ